MFKLIKQKYTSKKKFSSSQVCLILSQNNWGTKLSIFTLSLHMYFKYLCNPTEIIFIYFKYSITHGFETKEAGSGVIIKWKFLRFKTIALHKNSAKKLDQAA